VRRIDEGAIKAHADLRFRSEYDYALFEYYRSAKVMKFLDRAGVTARGRALDMGCGGGGMPLNRNISANVHMTMTMSATAIKSAE